MRVGVHAHGAPRGTIITPRSLLRGLAIVYIDAADTTRKVSFAAPLDPAAADAAAVITAAAVSAAVAVITAAAAVITAAVAVSVAPAA